MENTKLAEKAVEKTKELIELLGFDAEIQAQVAEGENEKEYININISGENLSLLIGFQGRTIQSIERILGLMIANTLTDEEREAKRIRVVIDVNNYKQRRFDNIREVVLQAIDQVRESGQDVELPVMTPAERRVAHMVVQEEEGIATESTGEEGERRVILKPIKE